MATHDIPEAEAEALTEFLVEIDAMVVALGKLPRHRSYSLAITRLEEARLWIKDRFVRD